MKSKFVLAQLTNVGNAEKNIWRKHMRNTIPI